MTIYKVDRKVDTVIVHMDIDTAEQLRTVLSTVKDTTRMGNSVYGSAIQDLAERLESEAEVRFPSALYRAESHENVTVLRDTTPHEMFVTREARFSKEWRIND